LTENRWEAVKEMAEYDSTYALRFLAFVGLLISINVLSMQWNALEDEIRQLQSLFFS
jgi:hypothetical protein